MLKTIKFSGVLLACILFSLSGLSFAQDFKSSITLEEDQTGFCGIDGSVDTYRSGFTGSGFSNSNNETGAGIDWNIIVSASGSYTFTWRYANISYVNLRSARLLVDDREVVSNVDFAGTGSWSTWDTTSIKVNLAAGNHTVRLQANTDSGLVNIDNLKVSGSGVAAGDCSDKTASTSSITTLTFEEDATGFCSVEGSIDNHRTGYTGSGFANTDNTLGAGIEWAVNIPANGSYIVTWRYSNISDVNLRPATLLIDGKTTTTSIGFPGTGSWSTWGTLSITVNLSAGQHLLRLQAETDNGLVNIDNMKMRGAKPTPVACSGDSKPTPAPEPEATPLPYTSFTVQEDTTSFCKVDGGINSTHTGFTGSGYANSTNTSGAGINWAVNVPESGSYKLSWRYANLSSTNMRSAKLIVDGRSVASKIDFPGTGSWSTWSTVSVSVDLAAGNHIVRLEATTASGLVNIDSVKIGGYGPQGGSCDGSTPDPANPTPTPVVTPPPVTSPLPEPTPTTTPTPVPTTTPTTGTMSAVISWKIPTQRENGETLRLGDIGGYEIIYRQTSDAVSNSVSIEDPSVSQYTLRDLAAGKYEILIAVYDTDGLYSQFSAPFIVTLGN